MASKRGGTATPAATVTISLIVESSAGVCACVLKDSMHTVTCVTDITMGTRRRVAWGAVTQEGASYT